MLLLWRRRRHVLGVATALLLPLCLGFRPSNLVNPSSRNNHASSRIRESREGQTSSFLPGARGACRQHTLGEESLVVMRLGLKARSKDDLMEKIGPLIESVTTAREMVPSDLTQDYGSVVLPDPLTTSEVSYVGVRTTRSPFVHAKHSNTRCLSRGRKSSSARRLISLFISLSLNRAVYIFAVELV